MGSRKEEERNEKIIRGLMKLPPNRRCINCNSLGPQYVCTNFWTFICTACSGIHREFTHRVKSVSMSKFTAQEVDALQKGGNQRARELFLKDWDPQQQRLPDSSNVDRVREFIKNVYVDGRYAGGKNPERPPRDMQGHKNQEDETRRASSYHSYSQSPPYDYQYENRRYGKPASTAVLTRKPGSDRGHYEGKVSSFNMCSPGRSHEDRFANDSVSSAGNIHSPNSLKDFGSSSSPPLSLSRESSAGDIQRQSIVTFSERDANRRTSSSGSFGSFDGNTTSFTSANSGNSMDVLSAPEKSTVTSENKSAFPSLPQAHVTGSLDLFQPSLFSQPPQTCTSPSLDFFAEQSHKEALAPKNEGWATFDLPPPQQMASAHVDDSTSMQWPTTQNFGAQGPSLISSTWHGGSSQEINLTMSWNAFEDTTAHIPIERIQQSSEPQVPSNNPSSNADHYLGIGVSQNTNAEPMLSSSGIEATGPLLTSHFDPPDTLPRIVSHSTDHKSVNPFDLSYDSGLDADNVLLDMSSLQATLPNGQLPHPFFGGGITDPWFPQNPMMSFGPASPQSGLAFMAGQPPPSNLSNITAQGPVASFGGNPFA